MRYWTLVLLLACLVTPCSFAVTENANQKNPDTTWMKEAKYGVFVHYLGGGADWNDTVASFDVEKFASQVEQSGAAYIMFTLGQNSGYYCSPNATYEKYAGYETDPHCSKRDLPMEIANALHERGIRLMLYLPSRSPQQDKQAMASLSDVDQMKPAPQEFTRKWSEVIAEWSRRYGKKVSGWWFDGSYNRAGWDDLSQPYNWNTWAAGVRAGNSDSLIAFNPGAEIKHAFHKLTNQQDYTAGEQTQFGVTPQSNPAQGNLQWQILSHLGTRWGKADGPRRSDAWMIDYVRQVHDQGGAVTIEVNISGDGTIYEPHLKQLIAICQALRP
jgi:alpha-L-fucosidase